MAALLSNAAHSTATSLLCQLEKLVALSLRRKVLAVHLINAVSSLCLL